MSEHVRATESKKSKDTLSTCDSSSEVSDEGYKSSQGNVGNSSASPNGGRSTAMIELSGKSSTNEASSHEGGESRNLRHFTIYGIDPLLKVTIGLLKVLNEWKFG